MSKSELIQKIAEQHPNNMTPKDVKGVIESLAEIGYKELKKTIKKPATKEQSDSNPFTKGQQYLRRSPLGRLSGLGR